MRICPQTHEVLGKPATNLTFLTYLAGRLDLTRFSLYVRDNHLNSAPLRSVAFQLRVAGLCIITKEVLNPFPSFILHIYYNNFFEKNQIVILFYIKNVTFDEGNLSFNDRFFSPHLYYIYIIPYNLPNVK